MPAERAAAAEAAAAAERSAYIVEVTRREWEASSVAKSSSSTVGKAKDKPCK